MQAMTLAVSILLAGRAVATVFAMTRHKTSLKNAVERMLHTCQTFGRVVVFVMNVYIVVFYGLLGCGGQQIIVDKRFRGLAGELHHHSGGGICVHVCVFTRNVVIFRLYNLKKHVASLCPPGYAALVAVCDVSFGNILAGGFHEFDLDPVLNFFDSHALLARHAHPVGYFLYESFILAHFCSEHGLADSGFDFLLIISGHTAVALNNCLYHLFLEFGFVYGHERHHKITILIRILKKNSDKTFPQISKWKTFKVACFCKQMTIRLLKIFSDNFIILKLSEIN